MTYEEFLVALAKTPRLWTLKQEYFGIKRIRFVFDNELYRLQLCPCPIQVITRKLAGDEPWHGDVMSAADGDPQADENIRRDLLVACGLLQP